MGLAASQCRLLLLTARLSDTEYRAQVISQRRMALAMQTEQIATDYSRALNNRTLRHVYDLKADEGKTLKELLTYNSLMAETSMMLGEYRVTLPDGRIAVASIDEIPGIITKKNDDDTYDYAFPGTNHIDQFISQYANLDANDTLKDLLDKIRESSDENLRNNYYNQLLSIIQGNDGFRNLVLSGETQKAEFPNGMCSITGSDGKNYVVIPALNNALYFQNAIRTGGVIIQKYDENNDNDGWANYDIISSPFVEDNLYTEDDAAAVATYESKSAMIQSQDKFLELELKQVETQHQAAQTEYDSVKKVIDKNIERSFKTFG